MVKHILLLLRLEIDLKTVNCHSDNYFNKALMYKVNVEEQFYFTVREHRI